MEYVPYPQSPPDFKKVLQWSHKTLKTFTKYSKYRRSTWERNAISKVDKVYRSDESVTKDFFNSSGIFEVVETISQQRINISLSNFDRSNIIDPIEGVNILKHLKKSVEAKRRNVCDFNVFLFKAYCISTSFVNVQEKYLESTLAFMKLSSSAFLQWLQDDFSVFVSTTLESLNNYPDLKMDLFQTAVAIVFERIRSHIQRIHYDFTDSIEMYKRVYGSASSCTKLDEVLQLVSTAFDVTEKNIYKRFQNPSLLLIPTQESLEEAERNRMEILEIPARVDVSVVLSCSKSAMAMPSDSVLPSGIESMQKLLRIRRGYKRFDQMLSKCLQILRNSLQSAVDQKVSVLEDYKKMFKQNESSLKKSLAQCAKFVKDGAIENRDRAATYLNFMIRKQFDAVRKPDGRNYVKELKVRTDSHLRKMRELGKHVQIFFSHTFQECSALLEGGLGEEKILGMMKAHKQSACHSVLRAYQAEFAAMVETTHTQLSYIIREMDMEETMAYAMGEFVRGLKWADHNYMAQIVKSSVQCLDSVVKVDSGGALYADFHFSLYEIENMITKFFEIGAREATNLLITSNSNEAEDL